MQAEMKSKVKNQKSKVGGALLFVLAFSFITSCHQDSNPKPRGYFRISFPEKKYSRFVPEGCPFEFDIPTYARVVKDTSALALPCWMNVEFPEFNGTLYLTYKKVENNLSQLYEEHRSMTMKHIPRASGIDELEVEDAKNKVYGSFYLIKGSAATNVQFYLTDSTTHFIRASLYFYNVPQPDSIAPVLNFISEDVKHLVQSFRWK
jgi:gliding motility-associated lipoprotein GldD